MLLCGLTGILGKGEALGAPVGCSKERWREYWGKCGVGRQGEGEDPGEGLSGDDPGCRGQALESCGA